MERAFEGRRVLITGGGTGIGWATARAFAAEGAAVSITYLTHEPGRPAMDELGSLSNAPVTAHRLDATREADVAAVVRAVAGELGGVDILVNNAGGLLQRQPIAEMDLALWNRVIEVNLTSAFLVSRAAMPHLPPGGSIVNLSSLAGRTGGGVGATPYATTKAALMGFTRGLAKELAGRQVRVNAVAPGLILNTPFHETFTPRSDQEAMTAGIPLGRAGEPRQVAETILWLCSPAAGFITGAVVDINGGVFSA